MSYVVLARKWRPRRFDEVVGQDYVLTTLKNAALSGRLAHALIFAGPRGVGKTSTARIVAMTINCSPAEGEEVPCGRCDVCREIRDGSSLDVLEVDAASHTGVADVREIIENINYMPSAARTKVYIIDEAHMLSHAAFNALLKTLEEPPPHALFILATTEVHKIPPTILSRCQRFDFKKVPPELIAERLAHITEAESIEIEHSTLRRLAEEADGSMRDALSLLDQLVAAFGSSVPAEEAERLLGLTDRALLDEALAAALANDAGGVLEAAEAALLKGTSPRRFAEDMLKLIRTALVVKALGGRAPAGVGEDEARALAVRTEGTTVETLELLFKLMLEGAEHVARSRYPRMALESALVKLALARRVVPLEEILRRIEGAGRPAGEGAAARGADRSAAEPAAMQETPRRAGTGKRRGKAAGGGTEAARTTGQPTTRASAGEGGENEGGEDFIAHVKSRAPVLGALLEKACSVTVGEEGVTVVYNEGENQLSYDKIRKKAAQLEEIAREFLGREDARLEIVRKTPSAEEGRGRGAAPGSGKGRPSPADDPVVARALRVFNGRIVSRKPLDEES